MTHKTKRFLLIAVMVLVLTVPLWLQWAMQSAEAQEPTPEVQHVSCEVYVGGVLVNIDAMAAEMQTADLDDPDVAESIYLANVEYGKVLRENITTSQECYALRDVWIAWIDTRSLSLKTRIIVNEARDALVEELRVLMERYPEGDIDDGSVNR